MKPVIVVLLVLVLAAAAAAQPTGNRFIPPAKDNVSDNMADAREGGETYADAYAIPSDLPGDFWTDSGATCDNRDDITLTCGSGVAPDVVYRLSPAEEMDLTIDLCGSGYDTALEIQDGIGVPILCNDDYCGLQSGFAHVIVQPGHTYYLIVDAYATNCGSYILTIQRNQPCILTCPPRSYAEGEPPCGPDYVDHWNGGCNSDPFVIEGGGAGVTCGKSGTYLFHGWSYRDTDWYEVHGLDQVATATLIAEFPCQLIFIYGTDCSYIQYTQSTADACEGTMLWRMLGNWAEAWIWVGPSVFSGVPCDADYLLELEGVWPHYSPVDNETWGEIKGMFR